MRALSAALAGAAVGAAMVFGLPASAQAPIDADIVTAAKAIQTGCVKRGEDSRVCSCSVGLAYAELDPKVFKLVPQIEPLLEQKNQMIALGSLMSLASANGLGVADLQTAYETIRENRAVVRQICRPLVPGKAG